MKSLRFIHFLFGILAVSASLFVAWSFIEPYFHAESSRIEAIQTMLQARLEAWHYANGRYPDSLQDILLPNSAQENYRSSDIRKMSYQRTQAGYTLSYGGLFDSSVTVSNAIPEH